MSIRVMTEVWEYATALSGSELNMLLALADNANEEREAFPSIRHISHKVRLKDRQTRYMLSQLEQDGYIIKRINGGRGGKGRESNLYIITPASAWPRAADTPDDDDSDGNTPALECPPAPECPRGGQQTAPEGGTVLPPESSLEPSIEPPTERDGAPSAGATVAPRAASVQDGSSGGQPSRPLPNHMLANMPAAVAVKAESPSESGVKPDIKGRPFVQFCMTEWNMTGLSDKLYKGFTGEAYEYYEGHRIPKGDLMWNWEHTPGFENFARARFEMFRAKANREKAGNSWASDYLANLKKFSVEKVDGKGWPGFNQWKRENPSQAKQTSGKDEPTKIVYVEMPDEGPKPWEVE